MNVDFKNAIKNGIF